MDLGLPYHIYAPSSWRSKFGIGTKPRAVEKQGALDYVEENYNISGISDDEGDAICMSIVLQEALSV